MFSIIYVDMGNRNSKQKVKKSKSYEFVTKTGLYKKAVQILLIRQDCG